jgi:hypothetical protein
MSNNKFNLLYGGALSGASSGASRGPIVGNSSTPFFPPPPFAIPARPPPLMRHVAIHPPPPPGWVRPILPVFDRDAVIAKLDPRLRHFLTEPNPASLNFQRPPPPPPPSAGFQRPPYNPPGAGSGQGFQLGGMDIPRNPDGTLARSHTIRVPRTPGYQESIVPLVVSDITRKIRTNFINEFKDISNVVVSEIPPPPITAGGRTIKFSILVPLRNTRFIISYDIKYDRSYNDKIRITIDSIEPIEPIDISSEIDINEVKRKIGGISNGLHTQVVVEEIEYIIKTIKALQQSTDKEKDRPLLDLIIDSLLLFKLRISSLSGEEGIFDATDSRYYE